jgi:hypothetical protein
VAPSELGSIAEIHAPVSDELHDPVDENIPVSQLEFALVMDRSTHFRPSSVDE